MLALGLALAVALSACDAAPEPNPSAAEHTAPDARPVMQVIQICGYGGITDLMLWNSGRLVFERDGTFREAQLEASTVERVVEAAEVLYSLDDYVMALRGTDRSSTFFTAETLAGQRKTVEVYGMVLHGEWPTDPKWYVARYADVLEKLRAFWTIVKQSLPEGAPIMEPHEVAVEFCCEYVEEAEPEALPVWPPELTGFLQGEAAREAVRLGGLGVKSRWRLEGVAQYVEVVPVLPVLHSSWLPRHPGANRYNIADPDWGTLYRFVDASQQEIASWYRNVMAERGWHLAREDESSLQIWVLPGHDDGNIAELRFYASHFFAKRIGVPNGIPLYPGGVVQECSGRWCQRLKGVTVEEARAWLNEYLRYLGWSEESLDVYTRTSGDLTEHMRLGFQTLDGETTVTIEEQLIVPPTPVNPPLPWPTPTPAAGNPPSG